MSMKIENKENIKKIHWISPYIQSYCPLGEDYCTYRLEIDICPNKYYFDYDVLAEWIFKTLNNNTNTREKFAFIVYDKLMNELNPKKLSVKCFNIADNSYIEI